VPSFVTSTARQTDLHKNLSQNRAYLTYQKQHTRNEEEPKLFFYLLSE
jgi:hypothetical protein